MHIVGCRRILSLLAAMFQSVDFDGGRSNLEMSFYVATKNSERGVPLYWHQGSNGGAQQGKLGIHRCKMGVVFHPTISGEEEYQPSTYRKKLYQVSVISAAQWRIG